MAIEIKENFFLVFYFIIKKKINPNLVCLRKL